MDNWKVEQANNDESAEKKQDDWSKVSKDPEQLLLYKWFNHLFIALLLIREDAHTHSLQMFISVLLLS